MLVRGIKEYMSYCNNKRSHQRLDRPTPFDWYEFEAKYLNLKTIPGGWKMGSIIMLNLL